MLWNDVLDPETVRQLPQSLVFFISSDIKKNFFISGFVSLANNNCCF